MHPDILQRADRDALAFLRDRLADLDDPRSIGEALKGARVGAFWKYRVGDYRIIASIEEPAVIAKILAHLERTAPQQIQSERPLGARAPPSQSRLL